MSSSNILPHTLDNLCKADKDKLVEMIKQLSEMKKRCAALEHELENKKTESERLLAREGILKAQIESTENKLYDAVEISKGSQARVEQLTSELQRSEAGRKSARARYRESQAEITQLRDAIRELKLRHERILVDTSVQTRVNICSRGINTDDYYQKSDRSIQTGRPSVALASSSIHRSPYNVSNTNSNTYSRAEYLESYDPEFPSENDEELTRLIAVLNH